MLRPLARWDQWRLALETFRVCWTGPSRRVPLHVAVAEILDAARLRLERHPSSAYAFRADEPAESYARRLAWSAAVLVDYGGLSAPIVSNARRSVPQTITRSPLAGV